MNYNKLKYGMFQAASKVSSMVSLVDMELVAGEVLVLPVTRGNKTTCWYMLHGTGWQRYR